MEKEQVNGKLDELKGRAKQAVAGVTGNPNLHDEGVGDELKGKAEKIWGDVKDAIKTTDRRAGTDVNDK